MNILIIGGTRFVGRHLVTHALERGHQITLFNRGRSNPGLFPNVTQIHGDRDGGLDALAGKQWDVVIDTCGYVPRIVRASAEFLAGAVERYVFISTISVYQEPFIPGSTEDAPLATLEDPATEKVFEANNYGGLKVLCEQAAEAALPGRTLIIRPGLIVGPYDPTNRFTYWPRRVAQGGEFLAPGGPNAPVQIIDGRDLAAWTIAMIEARATGMYNTTGPAEPLTLGETLDACLRVTGSDAHPTWVSEEFLLAHDVAAFMEMPSWVPVAEEGLQQVDSGKAIAAGLTFRPLETIIADTLMWDATLPADAPRRGGMAPEREQALLAEWHAAPRP